MLLKLQERGVERPLVDGELVGADLLDPSGDRVSMQWPHRVERLQHDEIKRAVKYVRLVGWHVLEVYSSDLLGVNRSKLSLFEDGRVFPAGTSHAPSTAQPSGGRTWWAHFEFTRINIEPIILRKKIED